MPTDDIPNAARYVHERPLLPCTQNGGNEYLAVADGQRTIFVPRERPDATENAKPTHFVTRVRPPRYP